MKGESELVTPYPAIPPCSTALTPPLDQSERSPKSREKFNGTIGIALLFVHGLLRIRKLVDLYYDSFFCATERDK